MRLLLVPVVTSIELCHMVKNLELSLSQTTDFSLFQTEEVCGRQFQIR